MKRGFPSVRNVSVTFKFVAAFLSILTVSMLASGLYLYLRLSESAISQAQNIMQQNVVQTRDSVLDKVKIIEDISRLFISDIKLQTFLGEPFENEPLQYEDYSSNIIPFVENIVRQNPFIHSLRIFMNNETIPEVYDSFYGIWRVRNQPWAAEPFSGWRGLHTGNLIINEPPAAHPEEVFSYLQPINSIRYSDQVGVLEIEVKKNVLFDVLESGAAGQDGSIAAVDEAGNIVVGTGGIQGAAQLPQGGIFNRVMDVNGQSSIVISVPIERLDLRLVGVFPVSAFNDEVTKSVRSIVFVLAVALAVFGVVVYLITNFLLSRLKVLVKAMKQVREDRLSVSVPVKGNDEFTQIAVSFNMMTKRMHDLVETVYKSRLMEREADLRALESQVNPHFLYNTLATITWVARKEKASEVVRIANSLAQFYRLVLNKGRTEIPVKKEIDMVKAYLEIEKFRFEDMFDVVYRIDEKVYEYGSIKNILQPLVENALVHGIQPKRSRGTLIVKAGLEGDMIYYTVIDDGVGMHPQRIKEVQAGEIEQTSGSGYAVRNIMERLRGYYGDRQRFEIVSRPGVGTAITILFAKERPNDA